MSAFLSAREVCQRLREAALGVLTFKVCEMPDEAGRVAVDIEGWHLLLDFEGSRLHHCEFARNGDGQEGALDSWQRYGTDPVSLLSTWELAQIERLLNAQTNEVAQ
ncbi:hypothetical protein EDF87_11081 [Pseudomonas helmanticensis]|uniref:DUF7693 domain-containing protein n=1 Tax=Pseudomonas helmanticensis TaxID=1471381 RepID=A0A4R7V743_9PSED|nr:hypothetical protein [Pseudomonas helmanticensis]TDV44587.1 hypothetical protein EDF87_11081 [Pseudomonas helmanticensis]